MRRSSGSSQPIELLIGETCRLSCELMTTALRRYPQKLSVVAAAVESAEIVDAYVAHKPDVCVVSWRLKDGPAAGLAATRQLHAMHETARILLLIDTPEREVVVQAFRAGALGIFSREESFGELCKGIAKVHSGQISATNEQLQYLVESLAGQTAQVSAPITDAKGATLLTPREQSLVDLVAQGRTNRDISRELNLSEHTVRNYLFRIFNKLGTSNRLELALYAINQKESSSRHQLLAQD
jgi:DNA-binding NarL/FixJ family response regulator